MAFKQGDKMSLGARLAYTFGAFGNDVFYFALSTYLINFITSHLFDTGDPNLNNTLVGLVTLIIMVLRIIELVIDPFIGNTIDRTRTRWGHFRPWIFLGGVISSVILCILFTNMGGLVKTNPWLYLVVFTFLYIIMDVFYSFKDIGFWSMLPALSFDSRERERTATFARVGSSIGGSLVGVVVMPIVLFFSLNNNGGTGDETGWFMFGFIVAATALISSIVVSLCTREKEDKLRENKEETKGISAVFKVLVKNDQLLWTALGYILYCAAIYLLNSLQLYYFQYIMGYSEGFAIVQTINMFVGVVSVLAFPKLAEKLSRKPLLLWCFVVMIGGIVLFFFAGNNLALVIIAAELFYIPQPVVFLVVLMTITDSVEYGQVVLGHRDESLALSVRPLCDKFGGAVSNGIVGQTAILAGMTTGATAATITADGVFIFKIMMFVVPAILIILAGLIFLRKITLTEELHKMTIKMLELSWVRENPDTEFVSDEVKQSLPEENKKARKKHGVDDE